MHHALYDNAAWYIKKTERFSLSSRYSLNRILLYIAECLYVAWLYNDMPLVPLYRYVAL